MPVAYYIIGLGSNQGPRIEYLRSACEAMAALEDCSLERRSAVYESPAVGPPQPDYLNAAVRLVSGLGSVALLARLQAIEIAHGRPPPAQRARWAPRTLDLDILWAKEPVSQAGLRVPHPELIHRWFALRPLLDVAPELADRYLEVLDALGPHPSALKDAL